MRKGSSKFLNVDNVKAGPSRRGESGRGEGVSYPGPATFGGPAVAQKYKYTRMRHLRKFEHFLPRGAQRECFPEPRCGSRRSCMKELSPGLATLM